MPHWVAAEVQFGWNVGVGMYTGSRNNRGVKFLGRAAVCALGLLLFVLGARSVEAQTQTATISGTATDSSGGALVNAKIVVTNVGTNVAQTIMTDSQGRYEVPDLPVGTYDIQASLAGFQTVTHKGVTLTVGAHPLVDFSLPVGQATQNVTVESQVSQVDTQSAAVSSLVSSEQVSQLPLNGRDYTQLIELAPGVQVINSGPGGGGASSSFYGAQTNYTIAGSRPEGQAFLLDNEDVRDFWEHGPGSASLGTALGIEGLQEFQVLTDTYGAQFSGNGAVVNMASKQGTNSFHGSAYEFLRNSALDARNFFDFASTGQANPDGVPIVTETPKPEFRQNQFGGSVGGPIKKDKLFFFANYEGLRNSLGQVNNVLVPEPYVLGSDELPCGLVGTQTAANSNPACAPFIPTGSNTYPAVGTSGNPIEAAPSFGSGAGAQSAAAATTIAGVLGLYPAPNPGATDLGGFANYTDAGSLAESEDYVLGRVDYNLSSKDSIFGRYVSDRARRANPFAGSLALPDWPEVDHTANQYFTLQERRIVSANVVNQVRFNFTRTFEDANTTTAPNPLLQWVAGFPDGTISAGCPGCAPLGANTALPYDLAQNKIGGGDDIVWIRGAHSFKVGVAITRVDSNIYAPFVFGGSYSFGSEEAFLEGTSSGFLGTYPGLANSDRHFREIDYAPYFEDDWKVSSKLTVNLGVRYDYATNPTGGPFTAIVNPPFPDTRDYFTNADGVPYGNGFTPVSHVFASNPNAENFEPRVGVAWDPFANHKTSVRAGFGLFHDQVAPRTYASGYYLAPPYASAFLFFPPPTFPNPFAGYVPGSAPGPITEFAGVNYNTSSSPYEMQYNLTIQRQITPGTVLSVGYIGSQGRHLFSEVDLNPPLCANSQSDELAGNFTSNCSNPLTSIFANPVTFAQNPKAPSPLNPATGAPYFGSLNTTTPDMNSNYNSLQVQLNHQFSHAFQGQVSYTYSKCLTDGSASSGLEQDVYEQADPYNRKYDYGLCAFDIRHNFTANGIYTLPFHGNRLVEGWQVTGILRASTGLPVTVQEGADVADLGAIQGDRPDYSGTCPNGRDQVLGKWYEWFNVQCYTVQPFGTLGDVPRSSIEGPGFLNLDTSIIKRTQIWESVNMEFRAEFFNIINHTNFGLPISIATTTGAFPFTQSIAPAGLPGEAASIGATVTPNSQREIQFALKFTF
jgi:hypothetical protein